MSQSATVPNDRVRIFNRAGYPLAEFTANVSRSWAITKEGRASFTIPTRNTNVVTQNNLQFGNYLLVENTILPSWVGIIDSPREWDGTTVRVNAFTMERIFSFRRGADGERLVKGSAGTIFTEMLKIVNAAELTVMVAGNIWTGGAQREDTFTPQTLDRNLRDLQSRSLEEYSFRGVSGVSGRLVVYADWSKQLGINTSLSLWQGFGGGNIEDPKAKEDGKIFNDVFGYGDGMTWTSKPQKTNTAPSSVSNYGLRQAAKEYRGVSAVNTVVTNNNDFLKKNNRPRWIMSLNALNVGNTFSYIKLGNYFNVILENVGFGDERIGLSQRARIMGMSYDPDVPNKIKLVLQEEEI